MERRWMKMEATSDYSKLVRFKFPGMHFLDVALTVQSVLYVEMSLYQTQLNAPELSYQHA